MMNEINTQEIDRRFDRQAKRITDLEEIFAQLRKDYEKDFERIGRTIAEYELALRKYFLELVDPLAAHLEEQIALLKNLKQEVVDKMGPPAGPLGI